MNFNSHCMNVYKTHFSFSLATECRNFPHFFECGKSLEKLKNFGVNLNELNACTEV